MSGARSRAARNLLVDQRSTHEAGTNHLSSKSKASAISPPMLTNAFKALETTLRGLWTAERTGLLRERYDAAFRPLMRHLNHLVTRFRLHLEAMEYSNTRESWWHCCAAAPGLLTTLDLADRNAAGCRIGGSFWLRQRSRLTHGSEARSL